LFGSVYGSGNQRSSQQVTKLCALALSSLEYLSLTSTSTSALKPVTQQHLISPVFSKRKYLETQKKNCTVFLQLQNISSVAFFSVSPRRARLQPRLASWEGPPLGAQRLGHRFLSHPERVALHLGLH
jgi:hypothetical protein